MGSLPEGTLCVYCNRNPAGYIPDGCPGPLCFAGPDDNRMDFCFDRAQIIGWDQIEQPYLSRQINERLAWLSKKPSLGPFDTEGVRVIIASFLYAA